MTDVTREAMPGTVMWEPGELEQQQAAHFESLMGDGVLAQAQSDHEAAYNARLGALLVAPGPVESGRAYRDIGASQQKRHVLDRIKPGPDRRVRSEDVASLSREEIIEELKVGEVPETFTIEDIVARYNLGLVTVPFTAELALSRSERDIRAGMRTAANPIARKKAERELGTTLVRKGRLQAWKHVRNRHNLNMGLAYVTVGEGFGHLERYVESMSRSGLLAIDQAQIDATPTAAAIAALIHERRVALRLAGANVMHTVLTRTPLVINGETPQDPAALRTVRINHLKRAGVVVALALMPNRKDGPRRLLATTAENWAERILE